MEFILWLIFIKIVPQAVKRIELKRIVIIEIKIVIIEKDCDKQKFSGNINEVIKAVLNSYYYYFFFFTKRFCTH